MRELIVKRLDASATGVYLIAVTPFTDNGALDLASTDRMVDFCLEQGVTGLTVLGIMGEASKLTQSAADRQSGAGAGCRVVAARA